MSARAAANAAMQHPWDRRLGTWWIAEDEPDQIAIAHSPSGSLTYGELVKRAHQLVHLFRSRGVPRGGAIALLAPNDVTFVELSLACFEGGWYFLPLNTFLTAVELSSIAAASQADALVIDERFAHLLSDEIVVPTVLTVGSTYEVARDAQPSHEPDDRHPGALFIYTSGTTGRPKGVRRPIPDGDPGQVLNDAAIFGRAFDMQPFAGTHLVSTAMYHAGCNAYYMGALNVGHALVIMGKFDPEEALQLIERHRVVSAYMVPTQFHRLLRLPEEVRHRYDLSSLHSMVHSAAPCPRDVKQRMLAWWGPVVWETYGGVEGAATIAKPKWWMEKPGTVGRAVRGVTVTIRDDEGRELPPGTVGAVYIGTQGPSFEYVGDEQTTKINRYGDQFTLGDLGHLDEDGFLFISDRAKDMIISGGVNIYPAEVESVLSVHPSVADVAVIGVPDNEWGEAVKAIVQPTDGVAPSDELGAELIAYCRERLASYKCPRTVDFRDSLPRTDAGKLYKRRIRDEYWQDVERAV